MKMWKTNFISMVMLLFCGSLSANPNGECGYFDGFYVGAAGGVATNHAKTKCDTTGRLFMELPGAITVDSELVNRSGNNIYEICPWGEAFAGWGKQCACYYWGGRFGINVSNFAPKTTSSALSTTMTDFSEEVNVSLFLDDHLKTEIRTVEYTLDFKPGIVFCDRTMVFGVIGAAFNRAQLKGSSKLDVTGVGTGELITDFVGFNELSVDKKKTSAGFRGGFGMEYMLNRCLSVQLSYVYTHYWSLSKSDAFTRTEFIDDAKVLYSHEASFSTKMRKQVTSIGLAYYF